MTKQEIETIENFIKRFEKLAFPDSISVNIMRQELRLMQIEELNNKNSIDNERKDF